MPEEHAPYNAILKKPPIRAATLKPYDDGYQTPTPEEVRAMIVYCGQVVGKDKLTGSEVAAIVGVEDHRSVRRWTAPIEEKGHRDILYAPWRLLCQFAGLVECIKGESLAKVADTRAR